MTFDSRDQLWEVSFDTYYHAYYEEMSAENLVNRWQLIDEVTKVLVALTASGSAVAGWALWSETGFKETWVGLAGFAAVLAIVHAALGVPGRIKEWGDIKRLFAALRVDLETHRQLMQVNPDFPVPEFTERHVQARARYGEGIQRLRNDILLTKGLRRSVQKDLNDLLKEQILPA